MQTTTAPEARPLSPAMAFADAAARGDLVATRKLLELVAPRMVRVVQMVLGSAHAEVDDVVQQSLIALVQALPSFRRECEPASFGARIAVRTAVAARKRSRVRWNRAAEGVDGDELPSRDASPAATAEAVRRKEALRAILDELPDEQAEAMALRYMLGWSLEEVADASGAPVNTVRSRVRLAKEALRRRIEGDPRLHEMLVGTDFSNGTSGQEGEQ
jgi:RNA polymerase sigma-70 factor (ECF subfamily)